jgi:hypothetical protein
MILGVTVIIDGKYLRLLHVHQRINFCEFGLEAKFIASIKRQLIKQSFFVCLYAARQTGCILHQTLTTKQSEPIE